MEAERPKIRNLLKSFARKRIRAADRESEVALEIDTSEYAGTPVIWSWRRFKKCHLYPTIRQEKRQNPRPPTQDELQQAKDKASGFRKFTNGKVILRDTTNGGEVIAVIEFTPLDELSPEEKNDVSLWVTNLSI
ncbi:hypothetical protein PGTUg99_009838 [Puccinia graminis f. sp. tritici]|uniref:Uncharacterized protein n=1 Tax=Puccinia graminis f. sp. tritici TaxID=56615 RepID=A0A5B0SK10_PUCGR|nr:hypothetical protein PGTUg99_009838 [Puccinia graminis f. sp. tritici]